MSNLTDFFGMSVVDGKVDTLLARLTSTRAGYLDNLDVSVNAVLTAANAASTAAVAAGKPMTCLKICSTRSANINWTGSGMILPGMKELGQNQDIRIVSLAGSFVSAYIGWYNCYYCIAFLGGPVFFNSGISLNITSLMTVFLYRYA